jgi:hypothetical protein
MNVGSALEANSLSLRYSRLMLRDTDGSRHDLDMWVAWFLAIFLEFHVVHTIVRHVGPEGTRKVAIIRILLWIFLKGMLSAMARVLWMKL